MSEEKEDNGESEFRIEGSVGEVSLTVTGDDEAVVEELFDEKLEVLIEAEDELSGDYHVEAGAGWLMAHANADSPEEAYANWLDMWEKIIKDTKELTAKEREQAGLRQ